MKLTTYFYAFVGAIFFFVGSVGSAAAQDNCFKQEDLKQILATNYKEYVAARGLTSDGFMMELYVGNAPSWTLVVTDANKISCIRGSGSYIEGVMPNAETTKGPAY